MSTTAVLRIAGYRLRLVPYPPYRLSRLPVSGDTPAGSVHMLRMSEGEVRQFELRPGAPDAPPAELTRVEEEGPSDWVRYRMGPTGAEVRLRAGLLPRFDADGSLLLGPDMDHWTVETSLYRCAWPEGLTLSSTEEGAPAPFEFRGPAGSVIFVHGPIPREELPPLEEMVWPEQRIVGRGELGAFPFIDVAYTHEERSWHQRHVVLPLTARNVLVLTAQAQDPEMPRLLEQTRELVESFRVGPPADVSAPAGPLAQA
jgi:hypothetical protein